MTEKLNMNLGNPPSMFFWSFVMLRTGLAVGGYWRPLAAGHRTYPYI